LKNFLTLNIDTNRIYGLDILRALAIIFVVAQHGEQLLPNNDNKFIEYLIFDGVSIFFVLSGFLIGGILIKLIDKHKVSFKLLINFWIRRWFRTLPNYFLILLILLTLSYCFKDNFDASNYLNYFIFSQNLYYSHPSFFPEAWSLSVEEWFYLSTPILIYILTKFLKIGNKNSLLIIAFGIILGVTYFRFYRFTSIEVSNISVWNLELRKQVFTRLDSLMFGVIGAYMFYYHKIFWNKFKNYFFVFGLLLFISMKSNIYGFERFGLFHSVYSFSINSLATLFLIPFLNNLKEGSGYIYRAVTYISLISYSLYLVHLGIVQNWIIGNINLSVLRDFNYYIFIIIRYGFYWLISIVISIILYKYFETPFMNLRNSIRFS
jgi:peptidoglycan/LPS O-acetylase OafA/YrhL